MTRNAEWSKLLFNNVHLLDIAAAIASGDDEVDSRTLQQELGLGQPAVYRVLRVLEGIELLDRQERASRTEPLRFTRTPHSFWAAARQLTATANPTS